MVSVAGGVDSGGLPSLNIATHTTIVPLYSDLAGMVSVYIIIASFSLTEPDIMSGNCPSGKPFTFQPMIASDDV